MANGRFTLGKQSGGTLGLVFPDGVSNTEVVLPESGELATKEYVDTGAGVAFVANDARVKTALNASGGAPIYACRAWVNFNGTGTVAIRASGNVSSITDNGVGLYACNLITAMEDNNYAINVTNTYADTNNTVLSARLSTSSKGIARIQCRNTAATSYDSVYVELSLFR